MHILDVSPTPIYPFGLGEQTAKHVVGEQYLSFFFDIWHIFSISCTSQHGIDLLCFCFHFKLFVFVNRYPFLSYNFLCSLIIAQYNINSWFILFFFISPYYVKLYLLTFLFVSNVDIITFPFMLMIYLIRFPFLSYIWLTTAFLLFIKLFTNC